jgi:acyl carrier protein
MTTSPSKSESETGTMGPVDRQPALAVALEVLAADFDVVIDDEAIDTTFDMLGLDSLAVLEFVLALQERLGVELESIEQLGPVYSVRGVVESLDRLKS